MKHLPIILLFFILLTSSCKKDDDSKNSGGSNPTSSCSGGQSTVSDIDGNVYNVVSIGNQCWMKENLKTTRYRNGDVIPTGLSDTQWDNTITGASAIYNNNYGKLYNWYAVADPRGLCPTGWHVPDDSEWDTLVNLLGGDNVAGGKMKTVGDLQSGNGVWENPNEGATNSSGFTGLPGGYRESNGPLSGIGKYGIWWSSSEGFSAQEYAICRVLDYEFADIEKPDERKRFGHSVRCIRD